MKRLDPFTADHVELRKAIDRLSAYGATALYDAIDEALHDCSRLQERKKTARKVLVAFTD